MTLNLDDEAIAYLESYRRYACDESYAGHLAQKILQLYDAQIGSKS